MNSIVSKLPDGKVHVSNMGPTWGRQDPSGSYVDHMNFAIRVTTVVAEWWLYTYRFTTLVSFGVADSESCNHDFIYYTWYSLFLL